MDNKKISDILLQGILYIVNKKIKEAPFDKTCSGVVVSIKNNNLYDISIQNKLYLNIPSLFYGFKVNDIVKVRIPQNQYSQMYIEGKYNMIDINKIENVK